MSNLRVKEMNSTDEERRVIITELNNNSCEICLFQNGRCIIVITTTENTFDIKKGILYHRAYWKFARNFLKSGLGNTTIFDIFKMTSHIGFYKIEFMFYNGLKVDWNMIGLEVAGKIIYTSNTVSSYTYDQLAKMTQGDIFNLSDYWGVIKVDLSHPYSIDSTLGELYRFEYKNCKFLAPRKIIDQIVDTEYLKKIGYLKNQCVLNLSRKDIGAKVAQAALLGKSLIIKDFGADLTPIFKN